ncbi:MAG: heavy-metal-associated domain-containing protein [Candidatus Ornithomonoglobus sp.]
MGNIIIIAIIAIIIVIAAVSGFKHFKGEGGCCGGGKDVKPEKKKLDGPVIATKVVRIDGMHCGHCKNAVEKRINKIDGAAAVVNLRKNIATVTMDREIDDQAIKNAVTDAGFACVSITNK